jgi:transcription antitermination factor NusG
MERKYFRRINEDLKKKGYRNIRSIVPELSILKKSIKGKTFYEDVPVLFNYGFMRIPTEKAYSRPFMNKLKREIPGIRTWLKSTSSMHKKKKKARIDNAEDWDDFSMVATCPRKEVRRFIRLAKHNKKYSLDDMLSIKVGDYVTLKLYPYEGVEASIKEINHRDKTVTLQLYPQMGTMEVKLPFDNVLYSVYQNYDPESLFTFPGEIDTDRITLEQVDNFLSDNQI